MTKPLIPPLPETVHKAFSWHYCAYSSDHELQAAAKDIGSGIATILEIIEIGFLETGHPILNVYDRSNLMRMAITSAKLLSELAGSDIDFVNKRGSKESK